VAPCLFALVQQSGQRDGDIRQDRPGLSPTALDDMLVFLEVPVFLQVQTVLDFPMSRNQILKLQGWKLRVMNRIGWWQTL